MAAAHIRRQEYMYGSAARAAERHPYEYEERRRVQSLRQRQNQKRNQEIALQIDLPYVIMLTAAVLCVLYMLVNYLHVQSSISGHILEIERMEQQLEQLRAENDALETSINTNIDLERVYDIATRELGMVYANRNQVLLYGKTESEYVRQYEDIPKY